MSLKLPPFSSRAEVTKGCRDVSILITFGSHKVAIGVGTYRLHRFLKPPLFLRRSCFSWNPKPCRSLRQHKCRRRTSFYAKVHCGSVSFRVPRSCNVTICHRGHPLPRGSGHRPPGLTDFRHHPFLLSLHFERGCPFLYPHPNLSDTPSSFPFPSPPTRGTISFYLPISSGHFPKCPAPTSSDVH